MSARNPWRAPAGSSAGIDWPDDVNDHEGHTKALAEMIRRNDDELTGPSPRLLLSVRLPILLVELLLHEGDRVGELTDRQGQRRQTPAALGLEVFVRLDGAFTRQLAKLLWRRPDAHRKTPYVARALTRYVTVAFLTASRWLQRKAWVRRAAESGTRPSDTTSEGGAK